MRTASQVTRVPLKKLRPAPWNPRIINDERFKNLCASIEADPGLLDLRPILATKDGTIYGGNMRYRAVKHLGWTDVPAVLSDIPEQLAKERGMRDNGSWGEWADDDLGTLLSELKTAGSDLDLLGFDSASLDRLLGSVTQLPEEDEADLTPPVEPITKPGDLWLMGTHRLLCGDSTNITDVERLMSGRKADMVFTDPPYGIAYQDVAHRFDAIANDDSDPSDLVRASYAASGLSEKTPVYVCCDWRSLESMRLAVVGLGLEPKSTIVWDKERRVQNLDRYFKQHELILYAGPFGGQPTLRGDVWRMPRETNPGDHPTPKPVELVATAIQDSSKRGDLVLDLFGGSGSTLIAAEQTDRTAYLMEIDAGYVDVTIARWQKLTGKTAVLSK